MKLTPIYKEIKRHLTGIEEIQLITWWNGQKADSIIHTTPAIYVEFPDSIQTTRNNNARMQQATLKIRVMLVNKLLTNNAGEIDESIISRHEELAMQLYENLQGLSMDFGDNNDTAINSLNRTEIQLNLNTPGMVITIQDFKCIALTRDRKINTEIKPIINIKKQ